MISEVLTLETLRALPPEEAAATLQLRRAEHPGSFDNQLLADWQRLDPAHASAWDRAERVKTALESNPDNELLDAMRRHARAQSAGRTGADIRIAACAAAVLVVLGATTMLVERQGLLPGPAVQPASRTYATGGVSVFKSSPDQEASFRLVDGSELTLDGDSAVTVTFMPDHRRLRLLKGQVFFEVAHQATRPFTVAVGDREVTDLGTRFDVRLRPNEVQVVLVEGRLSVSEQGSAAPSVVLLAGQQLTAGWGGRPTVSPADVQASTAWLHPSVTFRDETLDVVVAAINRQSPDQLVIRDPQVASLRITGVFRTGDAARFGRTLSEAYPVRIVRTGPRQLEIRAAR
jgi:transmembrane sensor